MLYHAVYTRKKSLHTLCNALHINVKFLGNMIIDIVVTVICMLLL